jgi:prevent-host-death family protein
MTTIKISEARRDFDRLLDEVHLSHQPILIVGKTGNAVLIAEEDWSVIQRTLFQLSTPGT